MAGSEPKLKNRIHLSDAKFYGESNGVKRNRALVSLFFSYGPDKFSKVSKWY